MSLPLLPSAVLRTSKIQAKPLSRRLRRCAANSIEFPTKPSNGFLEIWATATAVVRETSYRQLYIPWKGFSWLSPPSTGRIIALLVYWAVVIYMATAGAIVQDAFFWQRIGYRNAWVSIMQVPLMYLLASKCNVLGLIAGTSHERLNWLHRWVARTIFVTSTVHGWHFYTEWLRADFVQYQLRMMPSIKYGIAAWGVLLWSLVASFAPLRRLGYEFFVIQHIASAVVFLWLLYEHIPTVAQYNVWFAIAAICFDRVFRAGLLVWQNVKFLPNRSKCNGGQRIGHYAQLRAVGDSITVVTIKDVHFHWHAGQHLYLWIPALGPVEAHPYTIACAHQLPETCICNSIQLVVRKHKGFSRRIHDAAAKAQADGKKKTATVFVSGPYGAPPRWDIYETIVLISASTGASFTLPILESVLHTEKTNCTRRIHFLLTARQGEEIDFYVKRLHEFIERARTTGIELLVHIAVTQSGATSSPSDSARNSSTNVEIVDDAATPAAQTDSKRSEKVATVNSQIDVEHTSATSTTPRKRLSTASADSHVHHASVRPDVEAFIRGPVEASGGETSVVVCGGPSLVARVRNCVASLSDERAVHKGTGAQGIGLHVEEYSF